MPGIGQNTPDNTLVGHIARTNPHWHDLEGQRVLAVFSGPHAYVSPTRYEAENIVPTRNYVAVHADGICQLNEDTDIRGSILAATVGTYEKSMPTPWSIDNESDYIQTLAKAVVGFRIEIIRLEWKCKLNQNHLPERREKVVRALRQFDDPDAREIVRLMGEMLEGKGR
jgi:transcriptional regulator